ncbi:MAG: hypothetical protein LBT51_08295 [Fusobacteriaceae bacterium]|jgi:transketolase|nr:hypothetical protein [Fusobacteriaceae bacterium]
MRNTFVDTLFEEAAIDPNIYLITGDLGFGVLTKFWEIYPDRFINAGISEQNMASVAAGLALEGKNVFIYSIGNFPTLRCIEQIRNCIAYHKANVTVVAVGGGFAYGALGMTHHATEDIAIMRALPEFTIFTPCDPEETRQVTKLARKIVGPSYIRLGRGGEKNLHSNSIDVQIGKANLLKDGKDTAIFVSGAIANEALIAANMLEKEDISCSVYSFPTVKPIDKEIILEIAKNIEQIYTLEEHNIIGGFGSAVSEIIAESGSSVKIKRIGLQDVFTSMVGSQSYLRNYYGMSGVKIFDLIRNNKCNHRYLIT